MYDSMVIFDSSEFVSPNDIKTDNFYGKVRFDIAEIVSELDDKWASVKNVESQIEYRHTFKLKPFEDFMTDELQHRIPRMKPPATPQVKPEPRSALPAFQLKSTAKFARKSTPIRAVTGSVVPDPITSDNPGRHSLSGIRKPKKTQVAWIRVEDIHVPLSL